MTPAVVDCLFNEADLGDDVVLRPLRLRHLLCGDAAPPSPGARIWQVGRTPRNPQEFALRQHLMPGR